MNVELHMLQNFAPANLNRDVTGSPKECEFGGYRRARISSQCQKRAIRAKFAESELISPEHLGVRTARLADVTTELLVERWGRDLEKATEVARKAIRLSGFNFPSEKSAKGVFVTEYLVFLGRGDLDRFAELCHQHWDEIDQITTAISKGKEDWRKAGSRDLRDAFSSALDGRKAADVALFGRMLADLPQQNRQAASQVAHAISTNVLQSQIDFFTAVDDLKTEDEEADLGAGMMGTVEFNSSCFYRYANVDLHQLRENLGGDEELAMATLTAFLKAAVTAVPTGKQNSFAAQNPPSLVFGVVRERGLWSLANAFVKPIQPAGSIDLVMESVNALCDYWRRLRKMYGDKGIQEPVTLADPSVVSSPETLNGSVVQSLDDFLATVLQRSGMNGERAA